MGSPLTYAVSNEPKINIVHCPRAPKRGSKSENGRFPCKIALRLKKVCYKVSLCENRQRQSCRAFIRLSIRGDVPFYAKFWLILTHPLAKRHFYF